MLTARTALSDYVEAAEAVRGLAYCCRGCEAPVVLKAGQVRVAHFAHRPDARCAFGTKMSIAHLTAQRRIAEALRTRGVQARLEAMMPSLVGDRRVDVLAWPEDRPQARVAVEVQASDLTVELIAARSASYHTEDVGPLWLRLLDFGRFETVQVLPHRGTVWIEKYRARAWERWAHDTLGGRLWFLDQGTHLAWRGTFTTAHSYREVSTWYGPGGDEMSAGGDWRELSQWVDLELEGPFALGELKLGRGQVLGEDKQKRRAAWFVSPEETERPTSPAVRVEFSAGRFRLERELQVHVAGRWIPALVDGAPADWRTARRTPQPIIQG